MYLAPVVPSYYVNHLPITKASFCFTTEAVRSEDYLNYFRDLPNVVLDNPVYEGDKPVEPSTMKALIAALSPEFALIPDVMNDYHQTLSLANDYLALIGDPCLAAVPQGKSEKELMNCAREFYAQGIRRFGIPVMIARRMIISRREFTVRILDEIGADCRFHWLGADFPYTEERLSRDLFQVISCDTAEPFNCARLEVKFGSGKEQTRRDPNFATLKDVVNPEILAHNINKTQEWLNGCPISS